MSPSTALIRRCLPRRMAKAPAAIGPRSPAPDRLLLLALFLRLDGRPKGGVHLQRDMVVTAPLEAGAAGRQDKTSAIPAAKLFFAYAWATACTFPLLGMRHAIPRRPPRPPTPTRRSRHREIQPRSITACHPLTAQLAAPTENPAHSFESSRLRLCGQALPVPYIFPALDERTWQR